MAGRSLVARIVRWGFLLAVLAVSAWAFAAYRRRNTEVEPRFKAVAAEKANVTAKVTATGTLSARVTVQVGSQVSGRLAEVLVDFNSPVKKGQVIARLDRRLIQATLEKTRATLAQSAGTVAKAKANLAQAERVVERSERLAQEGLLNQADLDVARAARDSARADVVVAEGTLAQANAAKNEAEVNLGFTTIISPIDGIVLSRSVDVGQTVAASLQAPVLFTIAQDLRVIQVDTYVAEADVGKLKTGMEATFSVDAYPGQRFRGKVRDIRNAAQTMQNVVTYDAVLDVENPELKLKPGMTANVTFIYAEAKDVLSVPNAALRFRPPPEMIPSAMASGGHSAAGAGVASAAPSGPGGEGRPRGGGRRGAEGDEPSDRRTLWLLRGDTPVAVRVGTGVSDGTRTEVVSGDLKAGDQVIVELAPSAASSSAPAPAGRPPRLF